MPWNQGGGGPWGGGSGGGGDGGGKNPWGRPGGGGGFGQQPPNLEELLRKSQERMKRFMPGGGGSSNLMVLGILGVALLLWLASGFYRVDAGEVGLVTRFGVYVNRTEPGLNWHWPTPIESVTEVNIARPNNIAVPSRGAGDMRSVRGGPQAASVSMLTGDENIIEMQYNIQWRIADPALFTFNIRSQETLIRYATDSAMRQVVSQTTAQRALTEGRAQIAEEVQQLTQRILDGYQAGVAITDIQLQSVEPPQQVIGAFRDVQAAKANREQARNEAEAYRNNVVPRARGEAQALIFEAEAYRQRVVAEARGEANRFLALYESYRLAPDVTMQRLYLETMEQILRNANKVIMDQTGGGQGVVPYLPLPELRRPAGAAPAGPGLPANVGSTGGRP